MPDKLIVSSAVPLALECEVELMSDDIDLFRREVVAATGSFSRVYRKGDYRKQLEVCGIYAIFWKRQCIYIGESQNIKMRMVGHDHAGWLDLPDSVLMWVACSDRKRIERVLIDKCKPLLNGSGHVDSFAAKMEARNTPCKWAKKLLRESSFVPSASDRRESIREYFNAISSSML